MHYGITPIFADIDISTLQINIKELEQKISKKTKAFLIPNLIGPFQSGKKYID